MIPHFALAHHKPGIEAELKAGPIVGAFMKHPNIARDGGSHSGYLLSAGGSKLHGWMRLLMLLKSGLGMDYFADQNPYGKEVGNYYLYQYHPLASKSIKGNLLPLARYGDYIPHGDFAQVAVSGFMINSEINDPYYQWLIEEVLLCRKP